MGSNPTVSTKDIMKTLIVGDLHGKVEIVERALAQEHPVVFLGDIMDSWDRPIEHHLKCFDLIFDAIDAGKATCVYGNHELSYLMNKMRCSGWNPKMAKYVDATPSGDEAPTHDRYEGGLRTQMAKRFDYFQLYDNVLITHGGLDKVLWDKFNLTLDNLAQTLAEWCANPDSPAYWIGRFRGGFDYRGGIFWNDFGHEHTPIPELIQIVGHTGGDKLRTNGTTTCIDYFDHRHDFYYTELPN